MNQVVNNELVEELKSLVGSLFSFNNETYTILSVRYNRGFYHIITDKKPFSYTEEKAKSWAHELKIVALLEIEKKKRKEEEKPRWRKRGMSPRMKKNNEEFMKVRPGETIIDWEKRTRVRRIRMMEEIENSSIIKNKKAQARKKIVRSYKKFQKNNIITATWEHTNDFLYLHGLMRTWASLKFEIEKDDIEVLLYFYKLNRIFERQEFETISKAIKGKVYMIRHFVRLGYVIKSERELRGKKENVREFFQLSFQVNYRLKLFYEKYMSYPKGENITEKKANHVEFLKIKELINEIDELKSGKGTKVKFIEKEKL